MTRGGGEHHARFVDSAELDASLGEEVEELDHVVVSNERVGEVHECIDDRDFAVRVRDRFTHCWPTVRCAALA